MELQGWLSLAAAVVPSILIWVFRNGGNDQRLKAFGEQLEDFRKNSEQHVSEFRDENREQFRELYQEFRAASAHAAALETRLAKLEEWRHHTNNRLQILVGQVDEIRTRRN